MFPLKRNLVKIFATVTPQLTAGAVQRILNGEDVSDAVIQIISYEKMPGSNTSPYRFLISDGETMSSFVIRSKQLNRMVIDKKLEPFTIVRINECVCNQEQTDKKIITSLNLTVLSPGAEVGSKIGNPSMFKNSDKIPKLTTGAMIRILNGEDVSDAVIQILGCKKIPGTVSDRYRLLISDGVTHCPYVMLGTQLNHMVVDRELEKFTIFRINKCVCNEVQPDRKVIILLSLTVLIPGANVGKKIGNPVIYNMPTKSEKSSDNMNDQHNMSLPAMIPELTAGAVQQILNGEDVSEAVIQILGCKKIPGTGNDRYRLLISDGVTAFLFAMLGTQLNHMVIDKELEKFTIVRVHKYVFNQVHPNRKIIILLGLTVLNPGADIGKKIGNPESYTDNVNDQHNMSLSVVVPQLTAGALQRILDGELVTDAVIQLISIKNKPGSMGDRYQLLISDGVTEYPSVMLGTPLNHMVVDGELSKFSIFQINKYVCYQVQPEEKFIILLSITVLTPGSRIGAKIDNSAISSVKLELSSGYDNVQEHNMPSSATPDHIEQNEVHVDPNNSLLPHQNKCAIIAQLTDKAGIFSHKEDNSIDMCDEISNVVSTLQFNFAPIDQIFNLQKDALVDIIGVCINEGSLQTITPCTNKEFMKKDISLVDRSNKKVNLTLWGLEAANFDGSMNPVVVVKGARVSDDSGLSLSCINSSVMQINPDIKEAHVLKEWFNRENCKMDVDSISLD